MSKSDLAQHIKHTCIQSSASPIVLRSGWTVKDWINLPRLLCDQRGRALLAPAFYGVMGESGPRYNFIGSSVDDLLLTTHLTTPKEIQCFGIPMEPKRSIVGVIPALTNKVLLVDSVFASGDSMKRALEFCQKNDMEVTGVFALIDVSPHPGNFSVYTQQEYGIPYQFLLAAAELGIQEAKPPVQTASKITPPPDTATTGTDQTAQQSTTQNAQQNDQQANDAQTTDKKSEVLVGDD